MRRSSLVLSLGGAAALAALAVLALGRFWPEDDQRAGPLDRAVVAAERVRRSPEAAVRRFALTAAPTQVRIGGRLVSTWAFNGSVPGPELRVAAGDVVRAAVRNELPQPLTIHWHGIALRNDMDGVPALTQESIPPGGEFVYEFTVPDAGTYFYHPHTGTQLDRGLYGALVVEEPAPLAAYDRELTLLLDDWIDGLGESPDAVLERLRAGMGQMEGMAPMEGMGQMPGGSQGSADSMQEEAAEVPARQRSPLGDDTGDVAYPLYLVNGRPPARAPVYDVRPGEVVRLRLVNAGSDTPFRVAVGGRSLTVVASDGFPVKPVRADAVLLGMGERYDVLVRAGAPAAALPIVAQAEQRGGRAVAILRSGTATLPAPGVQPAGLRGRLLAPADLVAARGFALPAGTPDRTFRLRLTGDMASYAWAVEGPAGADGRLEVRRGERVRLIFENTTTMWHPMHLHGHTFQVVGPGGAGPRKDTVIVPAKGRVVVDFVADNPGRWALHCHNVYHAEAGMQTVVDVT